MTKRTALNRMEREREKEKEKDMGEVAVDDWGVGGWEKQPKEEQQQKQEPE